MLLTKIIKIDKIGENRLSIFFPEKSIKLKLFFHIRIRQVSSYKLIYRSPYIYTIRIRDEDNLTHLHLIKLIFAQPPLIQNS